MNKQNGSSETRRERCSQRLKLMDQAFADFLHFLGHVAAQHLQDTAALAQLERLYGFTVQFGLVLEKDDEGPSVKAAVGGK